MADVAGAFLEPNRIIDLEATQALRDEAEAAVEPVERTYQARENIVRQGDSPTAVHLAAIAELGLADVTGPSYWPVLAVVAVLIIVEAFYLQRFRPEIWNQVRRVALFGVLLVLGAGSARLAAIAGEVTSPYVIPVAAFGLMAAILFDGRIAVLMSIAMGVFAAVAVERPWCHHVRHRRRAGPDPLRLLHLDQGRPPPSCRLHLVHGRGDRRRHVLAVHARVLRGGRCVGLRVALGIVGGGEQRYHQPGRALGPRVPRGALRRDHHPTAPRCHRPQPSGSRPPAGASMGDLQPLAHGRDAWPRQRPRR